MHSDDNFQRVEFRVNFLIFKSNALIAFKYNSVKLQKMLAYFFNTTDK